MWVHNFGVEKLVCHTSATLSLTICKQLNNEVKVNIIYTRTDLYNVKDEHEARGSLGDIISR